MPIRRMPRPPDERVLAVSAVTGQGLDRLLRAITRALDQRGACRAPPSSVPPKHRGHRRPGTGET